ncbi:hypothetical protein ACELLULO517_24105 [Acidisoma cellulosilytica]|uniref:Uncharacterized protein n=1 Tax=Acidisoma cellulosilyticum TaxID=2802395 RepID=A0A963Z5S1_9PROT|nr:hypothetical protein [Acidisoma cellulosilyticum]MCB8883354.1 hypothetical protein [Acidisoma cellulosilyticum]
MAKPVAQNDDKKNAATLTWVAPMAGVAWATGVASKVLIPVPFTKLPNLPKGLLLSLYPPPDYKGSTCTIFIRNPEDAHHGSPGLRLDYDYNKSTKKVDYHWNVDGGGRARARFPNITNHMPVGLKGAVIYKAAKAFRIGGKIFFLSGALLDGISILTADRPFRRSFQVLSAWELSEYLAVEAGQIGAGLGTMVEPGFGTAIGGGIGALAGGFFGYFTAEAAAGYVYDFAEGTRFKSMPEVFTQP